MKNGLDIVSWILILMGIVWFLQGINILPGSFMTGNLNWALGGIVSLAVGIGLRAYTRNRNNNSKKE